MPLYQYKCNDCETIFERQQRMVEPPVRECPECQGSVRRLITSVGVVFKGSGFYVTDNRNGNGRVQPPNSTTKTDTTEKSTPTTEPTPAKSSTETAASTAG